MIVMHIELCLGGTWNETVLLWMVLWMVLCS